MLVDNTGAVFAFLVISLIGPGIGYALATTLPREAVTTMEWLSFMGAGVLILLALLV